MSDPLRPDNTTIGWIGTGVMGASMCGHLMSAGYRVTVHSRTRDKAVPLIQRGAGWADSPREVAERSNVVFSIVGYPEDVRQVLLGEDGALAGARSDSILVDMSTSRPSLAVEVHAVARDRGVSALDAPVSGGDVGAREARLSIMVGGDPQAYDRVVPLFHCMGKTVVFQGPAGSGQHTKMVNQVLIATGMIGVCEALLYAYKAGLNLEMVMKSVSGGAAGSWSLSNYGPRMLRGDFDPGFFVDHFLKDMGIALQEAAAMNLSVPGLALAHQLYQALKAQGHGRRGTQALILALARLSDVEWQPVESAGP